MPLVQIPLRKSDCWTCIGLGELGDGSRCPACDGSGKRQPARAVMTEHRIALLKMLDALGPVHAENLTRGQKQVGSSLQREGYARWEARLGATRHSLAGQVLHITDAGRAALASWQSVPARD